MVWTAEKEIDLLTGPAVPVRAYIESFLLGELTGNDDYLYPGFANAAAKPWRPSRPSAHRPWVGTVTNSLLSIVRSGTEVNAIGCMYTYGAASPHDNEYGAHTIPYGGITAFKVTATAPSEIPQPPAQSGPSRTPFDDVFGGYEITGYHGGYYGATGVDYQWPERRAATDECIAKAPDSFERRKYLTINFLPRSDFPTRPATPGWPAKPAS